MMIPLPWFAVAISTTLINGVTLGFIGYREKNRALLRWGLAWDTWALAGTTLALSREPAPGPIAQLVCGSFWVLSTLLFVSGCYCMLGRHTPRPWYAVGGIAIGAALLLGAGPVTGAGMIPLVSFQFVGLVSAGVLVIAQEGRRIGAWIGGAALVLLGLHVLDAPLVAPHPEWMPWGFVVATALQILAALGMVILHYERAREALLLVEQAHARDSRIRALGRAAGSVAHDFNNILTIMQGQLDVYRNAEDELERSHALSALDIALAQARRFTSVLLTVGREAEVRPERIDVCLVVRSQLELLRKTIPPRIALRFDCKDKSMIAQLDRALLEQIVMNLVANARDAIAGEGEIDVELQRQNGPPSRVSLRVKDSGEGMDPELQKRVFEPFFTTKGEGKGTGLGLASVQGAVIQLGGSVQVESAPHQGSCFEVHLPVR